LRSLFNLKVAIEATLLYGPFYRIGAKSDLETQFSHECCMYANCIISRYGTLF